MELIGQTLQETYRIQRLIGRGGKGEVYLAAHLRLPRQFAVKVLFPHNAFKKEEVLRFRREAEVVSALGHPHIIEVIDFNHTAWGAPYIVMEYLEGEDLSCRIQRVGRFSLAGTGRSCARSAPHSRSDIFSLGAPEHSGTFTHTLGEVIDPAPTATIEVPRQRAMMRPGRRASAVLVVVTALVVAGVGIWLGVRLVRQPMMIAVRGPIRRFDQPLLRGGADVDLGRWGRR